VRGGKGTMPERSVEPPPIVCIVDPDEISNASLLSLFESVGLSGECFTSAGAFRERRDENTGCVIIELLLADASGMTLLDELCARPSSPPVIIVTRLGDLRAAVRAMKRGAADFFVKPASNQELVEAVREAVDAHREKSRHIAEIEKHRARRETLTPRERQVLDGIIAGETNGEIAARLRISTRTVETHRGRALRKLAVTRLVDLLRREIALEFWNRATADRPSPLEGHAPS
jgi:two-component system response regulator FixJ